MADRIMQHTNDRSPAVLSWLLMWAPPTPHFRVPPGRRIAAPAGRLSRCAFGTETVLRHVLISLCAAVIAAGQVFGQTADRAESEDLAPGHTASIRVFGSGLGKVTRLWTPFAEFERTAENSADGKLSDQAAAFSGIVPADVVPGICRYRLFGNVAATGERLLVVDDLPWIAHPDGSESVASAPLLPTTCCFDGQLVAASPRFYRLTLKVGESAAVEVFARRIDSEADPVLRVLAPGGREVVFCDDTPGLSGDAQLRFTAESDGEYVLELRDVKHGGGARYGFHLRIGQFPLIRGCYPRATQPQAAINGIGDPSAVTKVQDVPDGHDFRLTFASADKTHASADTPQTGFAHGFATAAAPVAETEPNDSQETATSVAADAVAAAGRFDRPGDADWFRIPASAGTLCVTAHTRELGSPADVVLQLWNSDGKKLAESDDNGADDAQLTTKLPGNGDYFLAVTELTDGAGDDRTYDLEIDRRGRLELTFAVDVISVPQGGTAAVPLSVRRIGISEVADVHVNGLPEGIHAHALVLNEYQKSAVLTLSADEKRNTHAEITVFGRVTADSESPAEVTFPAEFRRIEDKKSPLPFRRPRITRSLFVATTSAAPFSVHPEKQLVTLTPQSEAVVGLKIRRDAKCTEPVVVAVTDPKAPQPPGITLSDVSVAGDTGELVIKAGEKTRPGTYSLDLQGTLTGDKTTLIQPVPTITLEIVRP
ncbi:MAG: hypothetical protein KDA89_03540 [Planctomycetaceae bacterium]|nr:hypothetical protein [Planctomycetaceae bacterium]